MPRSAALPAAAAVSAGEGEGGAGGQVAGPQAVLQAAAAGGVIDAGALMNMQLIEGILSGMQGNLHESAQKKVQDVLRRFQAQREQQGGAGGG